MNNPLVSIIMPTRNRAHFISDAISSVISQTYHNWELLILDDASDDETEEIARIFSFYDSRIKYMKNETKRGIAENRDALLKMAAGKFVGHLDDDDFLRNDAIERIMQEFSSNEELALVYSDFIMVDEDKNIIREDRGFDFEGTPLAYLGYRHFTIYKKDIAFSVGGFNLLVDGCEDGDLFMRIAKQFKCRRVPEFLYFYRSHKTNSGHKRPDCRECLKLPACNYYRIWKEEYDKFAENADKEDSKQLP